MNYKYLFLAILSLGIHAEDKKPNVIIFLVDDLGWSDISLRGADIDTPAIDSLFSEGMTLDRFYATPICSPTRAALMTGRDPMRLGMAYGVVMPWMNNGIHPDEHFMPESFQAAGYQTAMVGKWHLGHSQETFHPNSRGFDDFYGHMHTEVGYFPPFANLGGVDFQRNGITISDEGYETFLLADEASRWIKDRDTDKPFFLYMPFIAPHSPLEAPDELVEKYSNLEDTRELTRSESIDRTRKLNGFSPSARPMYAAVVDALDQAIGQVLETLESEEIEEETIILFSSDNGGAAYAGGGADNYPLRGGKGDTYEGGIRVIAAMRWAGRISPKTSFPSIMTVMDVFPTLAGATNIEMMNTKELWGRNMWPAIKSSKKMKLNKEVFFASETPNYGEFHTTVFNEKWKLVQVISSSLMEINVKNQLFDISNDPNEYNDLASEYPKLVRLMAEKIRKWRALHPISGTRVQLVPPPGWRAPKDWTRYTIPHEELQNDASLGFGVHAHQILDYLIKDHGRIIYDCKPGDWERGRCKAPEQSQTHQH
ncbi:MAG: sulfatase-like hydrolase/transferase [Gammaproteobacteria bacterium]|nr:sulfatase-like hydrolase/transferase [Gammaproteobacteria bacterium]